jgi:hypothetical protein
VRRALGGVVTHLCVTLCLPTGGSHTRTTGDLTQRFKGKKRRAAPGTKRTQRGQGSIVAGVLHLASLQRGSLILRESCYNVVTPAPTWVTILLYPTASERGECTLAMLFWVLVALAVVGVLAIVWGLYLLARRWL